MAEMRKRIYLNPVFEKVYT